MVTNTNDSGAGSLRAAVASANATAENDTINFAILVSGPNCTAEGCTITLMSGELTVNSISTAGTLTITNSTGARHLRISGNNTSRVFVVASFGNLTINGVTITNGTTTFGGGIINAGTMTLTNSAVSGNTANDAGGIFNDRTMTLTNSTVSGNTAAFDGGGIFNQGTLSLTSVTVTNNRSTGTGCTTCAGGITNFSGTTNLNNTIVAGNTIANAFASPDFGGAVSATSSYNIIGNGQGTTGITNGTNGNQVGAPASPIDPRLAPLADNYGTTQTHALMLDSPAIDKGSSFGLTTDQRGFLRPVDFANYPNAAGGDGADIGAFELQNAPTAALVSVGGRVMTASGRGIRNVHLTLTDSNGEVRAVTTTSFGYYRFNAVQVGETYILSAAGKRYTFSPQVQVLNINEETNEVNFIANSKKSIGDF